MRSAAATRRRKRATAGGSSTSSPLRRHRLVILLVSMFLGGELVKRNVFSTDSGSSQTPTTTSSSQSNSEHLFQGTNETAKKEKSDEATITVQAAVDVSPHEVSQSSDDTQVDEYHEDDNGVTSETKMTITTSNKVQSIQGTEDFFDNGDPHSSKATVISFAYGYKGGALFKRFVGSLRATGYIGHVALFVDNKVEPDVLSYLDRKNVSTVVLHETPCTHGYNASEFVTAEDDYLKDNLICLAPYSDIKMRWSKYPLSKDWLEQCTTCTGPVLIMDFRDVLFQRDPFHGAKVEGLQVFEEYYRVDTTNWLTQWPIHDCYGVDTNDNPKPMLCSGTTIGTREAMIQYLDAMHAEMLHWVANKQCHIKSDADDQSIHNYLVYYKPEVLPSPLYSLQYRTGIVNTIGNPASIIWNRDQDILHPKEEGDGDDQQSSSDASGEEKEPYMSAEEGKPWLSLHLKMTDSDGFLLQLDNVTRSRVTHQVDRFGEAYAIWEAKLAAEWE